jgi:lipopolysaccharide biosynthesis regulator YciM
MTPLLFLLLPVAATCGWYMGQRLSRNQANKISPKIRRDYFKGLNYLINEQPDKAVDVFVKLLEVDSDTVETHLALGSLFRRRGEVDRAIRVHQNLIARPTLAKAHRLHALSELGQDYLRAGVLDRAERLFLELVNLGDDDKQLSLRFLLHIYQQEKDWLKAIETAQKLLALGEPVSDIIAQYHCELAEQLIDTDHASTALPYLKRAQQIDHNCIRASMIRARLEYKSGRYKEAIRYYKQAIDQDPDYISEIVTPLSHCYQQLGEVDKLIAYLEDCLEKHPRISLVLEISTYLQHQQGDKMAIEFIARQIQHQLSLRGLSRLVELYLLNASGDTHEKLLILQNFMQKLLADKPVYRCTHCGFSGKTLYWLCPSCQRWNMIKPIQGLEGS